MKILLLALLLALPLGNVYADSKVIGSPVSEIQEVTEEELYMIFTLRKTVWEDGRKVKVLYLPFLHTQTVEFSNTVLDIPVTKFYKIVKQTARKYRIEVKEYESNQEIYKILLTSKDGSEISYSSSDLPSDIKQFKVVR